LFFPLRLGHTAAAVAAYRRAVALPDSGARDSQAIQPLARLLASLGRAQEAAEVQRLVRCCCYCCCC